MDYQQERMSPDERQAEINRIRWGLSAVRATRSAKRARSALAKWLDRAARWIRGGAPAAAMTSPNLAHGAVAICYDHPVPEGEDPKAAKSMSLVVVGHGATLEQRAALRKILDGAADRAYDALHPQRQGESGSRKE